MPTRTVRYGGREYAVTGAHPAADCLPWATDGPGSDFPELVASMKSGGFRRDFPVVRHAKTGLLVNGRRRELAARVAGVEPVYRDVDWGDAEVVAYVESTDLHRRSLTPAQRAAAIVQLADLRAAATGGAQRGRGGVSMALPDGAGGSRVATVDGVAAASGASRDTVLRITRTKRAAPELMPAVVEGRLKPRTAADAAERLTPAERAAVAAADDPLAAASRALDRSRAPAAPPAPGDAKQAAEALRGAARRLDGLMGADATRCAFFADAARLALEAAALAERGAQELAARAARKPGGGR